MSAEESDFVEKMLETERSGVFFEDFDGLELFLESVEGELDLAEPPLFERDDQRVLVVQEIEFLQIAFDFPPEHLKELSLHYNWFN